MFSFLFPLFVKGALYMQSYGDWHYRGHYSLYTKALYSTFWPLAKIWSFIFSWNLQFEERMLWYILWRFQIREQSYFFLIFNTTVLSKQRYSKMVWIGNFSPTIVCPNRLVGRLLEKVLIGVQTQELTQETHHKNHIFTHTNNAFPNLMQI